MIRGERLCTVCAERVAPAIVDSREKFNYNLARGGQSGTGRYGRAVRG